MNSYSALTDQKYYLNVKNIAFKQKFMYKSMDISKDLIVYGTDKTTGAVFVYKRAPYAFFKAIAGNQSVNGPIEQIKISDDQMIIAFSNAHGDVAVHSLKGLLSKTVVAKLDAHCTSMYWTDRELYCGDANGCLSVISLSFLIGRNLISVHVNKLLQDLEGKIVQIDGFSDYLLVSSTTKTILCNNEREEFKQIGNRPRNGKRPYGGCFMYTGKLNDLQNKRLSINEESLLLDNVRIFTCRPGMRLWEVDMNGCVRKTHEYKHTNYISQHIHLTDINNQKNSKSPILIDENNQFQFALPLMNQFIFTWNSSSFFIINSKNSKIVYWSNSFDGSKIINIRIVENIYIYIYMLDGRLFELQLFELQDYALYLAHSSLADDLLKASDVIKNNLDFFLNFVRNSQNIPEMRIFLRIRDYLIAQERKDILISLSEFFDELTNTGHVVILGKSLFPSCQLLERETRNGNDLENIDIPQITNKYCNDSANNNSINIDRAVKQLYIIHQTSLVSNVNYRERLIQIFDQFNMLDIQDILDELENLFLENEEYNKNESKKVVSKIFLEYLQPEIIFEIDDEKTLNYISSALVKAQNDATEINRCRRCEYPLNCSTTTGYEEIGNILQQFYWSRKEYEKCFELCREIPQLLKITGKFLADEKQFDKMISYAINLGDLEILHKSLELFNDITLFQQLLDDYVMATVNGNFKCLKCAEINHIKNVHKILTWDCLFQAIEFYLTGHELIDLLVQYSDFIPKGSLSRQFYMKILVHARD